MKGDVQVRRSAGEKTETFMSPLPPRNADKLNPPKGKTKIASVTVFYVGPQDQDLRVLADILDRTEWKLCPGTRWTLAATDNVPFAAARLHNDGIPIVLCERQSVSGTWKDVLDRVGTFSVPPM